MPSPRSPLHSVVLHFFLFELNSLLIIRSTGSSSLDSSLESACSNPVTGTDFLSDEREREREKLFQSVTSIDRKISFSSSFARVIYPVILCGQDQSRKFNYLVDKSCRFAFFEILWYFDEDNSLLSFINIISANVNMIFSFSRIIRSGFLTIDEFGRELYCYIVESLGNFFFFLEKVFN